MAKTFTLTEDELFTMCKSLLDNSQKRLAQEAGRIAVEYVYDMLEARGVIDSNGKPKIQIRYLKTECYPPLFLGEQQ